MRTARGDNRQRAIEHAMRTTGTVLVCGVGVFSGDGKRGLDPSRLHVIPEETKRFLAKRCVRFTAGDRHLAIKRARFQEYRCAKLAKQAIDQGKYETARKLCDLAESKHEAWKEWEAGERTMYRITS